jgi:hypothetical protein
MSLPNARQLSRAASVRGLKTDIRNPAGLRPARAEDGGAFDCHACAWNVHLHILRTTDPPQEWLFSANYRGAYAKAYRWFESIWLRHTV